jgi:carboxypeptidase C (cathepsin A)
MMGLFQEHGPCKFDAQSTTPTNNTYSWNNNANILYIDQPIGVGFSLGTNPSNSIDTSSPYVWNLIQAFYAAFPEYASRDFGIFTESYGGHYGAEFAQYIQEKNAAEEGEHVNLVALGINNGLHDAMLQEPAYPDYALNNSYRPLINATVHAEYMQVQRETCCQRSRFANSLHRMPIALAQLAGACTP